MGLFSSEVKQPEIFVQIAEKIPEATFDDRGIMKGIVASVTLKEREVELQKL